MSTRQKVLVLATDWAPDYWDKSKEAGFPKLKNTYLSDWDDLKMNCPLPGLGVYIKAKKNNLLNLKFVYIKIVGMRCDQESQQPFFDFEVLKKAEAESKKLIDKLPQDNRRLFSTIEAEKLNNILKEIGEEPPAEWLELFEIKSARNDWRDWLGNYFLELAKGQLGNNCFEDRIYELMNALGFHVVPKGHKIIGEYPDGVAAFDNYAIVYDCKNRFNYIPTKEDIRAVKKYLDDEKLVRNEKEMCGTFIAKSFNKTSEKDALYLTVESLLYLLYKKLLLGNGFTLNPIKKIISNKMVLTQEIIDKEWIR